MKNLIILVSCFCLCFCSRQKPNEMKRVSQSASSPHSFYNIKYEDILNSKEIINLSQIAADVEYVQLETKENCILGKGLYYFITDEYIFVQEFDHIMKFSRNGKFLKQIGTPGEGPGKIDLIKTVSLLPDEELICIQTTRGREILFYSFDGKLKKTFSLKRSPSNTRIFAENRFINYDNGSTGKNIYNFTLVNEKIDTISSIRNNITFEIPRERRVGRGYPFFDPFCGSISNIFIKSMYCDTVYSIISDTFEPKYFIDLGKYKFPDSLRYTLFDRDAGPMLEKKINDYYFVNIFQTLEKVFLTAYSYGDAPTKCGFFDVKTLHGKLLVNDQGISTGFVNDWDGGTDFWPQGMISDNQIFMPIRIADLKKYFSGNNSRTSVKFPDKQQQLRNIISKTDNSNNPIIMIVTLTQQ